jgi:hypothetical protein
MLTYDLCIAWNWEYDTDFIGLLDQACRERGLSLLQVTPGNLEHIIYQLNAQEISFGAFFDRASEADERFLPLVRLANESGVRFINSHEYAVRAADKSVMHPVLIHAGLHTPYTIVLPSWDEQPEVEQADLSPLGEHFVIKPACGSGGDGVLRQAASWAQVLEARREHHFDKYLLQACIEPKILGDRPAWFREIYCTGKIYICWWSHRNGIYIPVTPEEENCHELGPLYDAGLKLAEISGLDLFSTEIAYTPDDLFVVVDYVNDPIDLRMQSNAMDGVPDWMVQDITRRLAEMVGGE